MLSRNPCRRWAPEPGLDVPKAFFFHAAANAKVPRVFATDHPAQTHDGLHESQEDLIVVACNQAPRVFVSDHPARTLDWPREGQEVLECDVHIARARPKRGKRS